MLSEVLQELEPGGFVIIRDTAYYSGRRLVKYYINGALKRGEAVHVLGFEVPEQKLCDKLDSSCLNLLHFQDVYTDPLGWTQSSSSSSSSSSFTVKHFSATKITQLLQQKQHTKVSVLVIDSLSCVLRHHDPIVVCQELQKLSKGGSVRNIVGLLHADLHQPGIIGALSHLASAVITVKPVNNARYAVAKISQRKKSGKVMQKEEFFSLTEDLTLLLETKPNQSEPSQTADLHIESKVDPTSNLTFNLRLSETEKEAKERVALPFVFSEEKKSAFLKHGRGTGRIMYEPDANDDFDEEDPDDDLDV